MVIVVAITGLILLMSLQGLWRTFPRIAITYGVRPTTDSSMFLKLSFPKIPSGLDSHREGETIASLRAMFATSLPDMRVRFPASSENFPCSDA